MLLQCDRIKHPPLSWLQFGFTTFYLFFYYSFYHLFIYPPTGCNTPFIFLCFLSLLFTYALFILFYFLLDIYIYQFSIGFSCFNQFTGWTVSFFWLNYLFDLPILLINLKLLGRWLISQKNLMADRMFWCPKIRFSQYAVGLGENLGLWPALWF